MIRAIWQHTWLLLTLRHPMTGLPRTFGPWAAIVVASSAVAWLRWGSFSAFVGMLIMLGLIAHFSPRLAVAYAMLSIGVDVVAIPAEMINDGPVPVVFSAWEIAGLAVAAHRVSEL